MVKGHSIWNYIRNYKFNSLFIKNFLLILTLVVFPLVGASIGIYRYNVNIFQEEIGAAHINSLSKVRDMMDMVMKEVDRLSVRIASDIQVEQFVMLDKGEFPDYSTISILQNISSTISVSASDYINSIYVYSPKNNYILTSTKGGTNLDRFYDRNWLDEYTKQKDLKTRWISPRKVSELFTNKIYYFISSFYLAPLSDPWKGGVAIVNLDIEKLRSLISNTENNRIENIYISDKTGTVLFSRDISSIGENIDDIPGLESLVEQKELSHEIREIKGVKQVITRVDSVYNDWMFISITPLKIYGEKMEYLNRLMWSTIFINIIIAIAVSFIISIRVFMPIKGIMALLENPENHIMHENDQQQERLNEYRYIAMNILKSFDENKHMEEELNHRMTMLKQAQTAALQSQINPHFLYNTLQTINWLAMGLTKGENEATRVIEALSDILRTTMETETHLISIRNEIIHTKRYIEIQQIRYKNKFEVQWNVEENIMDNLIAKVTLQPLIENAIYHGIKPKKEKGHIIIQGFAENNHIIFILIDDGVGMREDEIGMLNKELTKDYVYGDQHIGIRNVNQRIKLIFGEEYGIYLKGSNDRGLEVKIVIPRLR